MAPLLFLIPFFIVIKISLSDTAIAMPPYTPTFDWAKGWTGLLELVTNLDFENFTWLLGMIFTGRAIFRAWR